MTKTHIFNAAVIAFAVFTLAVLIWGFDKGFDLTDGGCYLLRYQQNQPSEPSEYWYEHILVKAVIPTSLRTVKSFRFIALLVNLLSTFLFALAISKASRKMHGRRISLPLLALMMLPPIVLAIAGLPPELSYNSLNQFFLISSTALLVFSLSYDGFSSLVFAAAAAGFSSLLYLVKLPTGMLMSVFTCIVLLLYGTSRWRRLLVFISFHLIFMLLWSFVFKPNFVLKYYHAYYANYLNGTLHNSALVLQTLREASLMFINTLAIAIPISTAFWLARLKRDNKILLTLFWCLGLFLLAVFFSLQVIDHVLGFYVLSRFFLMLIFLTIFTAILQHWGLRGSIRESVSLYKPYKRFLPLLPLLIVVPYIGAFGSFVPMDSISKYYYASFMGLIALLAPLLNFKYTKLVLVFLSVYLTVIGLYHYVKFPFGYGPLYKQTVEYKGIKYDPKRAHFLKLTEAILTKNGFNKEQGLIVAYTAPGIVYLNGSYHPGGILWKEFQQEGYFRNLKQCHLTHKPVVMSLLHPPSDEFVSGFNAATGLDFHRDYWLVDPAAYTGVFLPPYIYFPNSAEVKR